MLQKIKELFSKILGKIKERRVLYPYLVLSVGGLILLILGIYAYPFLNYISVTSCIAYGKEEPIWFFYLLFTLAMDAVWYYVCKFLWRQCFERLVVTREGLEWRCLFLRSVKLKYSEIKYIDIRPFDEGNRFYNSPEAQASGIVYEFLVVSTHDVPRTRIDKIKSSREKQIIKFRLTRRTCAVLSEMYPEPRNRIFASKLKIFPQTNYFRLKKLRKKNEKRITNSKDKE